MGGLAGGRRGRLLSRRVRAPGSEDLLRLPQIKVKTAKGNPGDDPREATLYAMPPSPLPDKNGSDTLA